MGQRYSIHRFAFDHVMWRGTAVRWDGFLIRRLAVLFAACCIALAGCAPVQAPPDAVPPTTKPETQALGPPALAGCCCCVPDYPDWMVQLAERNIALISEVGQIQLRPGRMTRQPKLRAILEDALEPMDVLLFHSDNRVSGLLIPGQFTHGAVYLGTEPQMRASGLWSLPSLAPWQADIADGARYLEAVSGGVRLATADIVLDTDAVVVLRPQGMDRRAALGRGLAQMGVPFDMLFDAEDPSKLFCAELIALMYPEAELPLTVTEGRSTILPDALVAGSLTKELPFQLVGYLEATPRGGARVQPVDKLVADLRAAWPQPR